MKAPQEQMPVTKRRKTRKAGKPNQRLFEFSGEGAKPMTALRLHPARVNSPAHKNTDRDFIRTISLERAGDDKSIAPDWPHWHP